MKYKSKRKKNRTKTFEIMIDKILNDIARNYPREDTQLPTYSYLGYACHSERFHSETVVSWEKDNLFITLFIYLPMYVCGYHGVCVEGKDSLLESVLCHYGSQRSNSSRVRLDSKTLYLLTCNIPKDEENI